jgi:transcriptional regulator with XRE-family HTH domain
MSQPPEQSTRPAGPRSAKPPTQGDALELRLRRTLALRIREELGDCRRSSVWLSDVAGVARGQLNAVLHGRCNPSLRSVVAVARALECHPAALLRPRRPSSPLLPPATASAEHDVAACLARHLAEAVRRSGSATGIARELGRTSRQLRTWMNSPRANPRLDILARLAHYLGREPAELLEDSSRGGVP